MTSYLRFEGVGRCGYAFQTPQWLAYLLPDPAALGSIPGIPKKISKEKIVNVVAVNQWHCREERGQWLENVDGTHPVLASGKLVLQNKKAKHPTVLNHLSSFHTGCTML